MSVMEKPRGSSNMRSETQIDREMEEISTRVLAGQEARDDYVEYERLLTARRNRLFNVMPRSERNRLLGRRFAGLKL